MSRMRYKVCIFMSVRNSGGIRTHTTFRAACRRGSPFKRLVHGTGASTSKSVLTKDRLSTRRILERTKTAKPGPWYGWQHEDAFDALFERNELPEVAVEASKGDVVFFHGRLIHRGGPILEPGAFRHSFACHYIPQSFNPWPYEELPRLRISFDRVCRFTPTH